MQFLTDKKKSLPIYLATETAAIFYENSFFSYENIVYLFLCVCLYS